MPETYFVTGAQGCIGAWVVKTIVERGDRAVVFDLSEDARRLRLVLDEERFESVQFLRGDITDLGQLRSALEQAGARRVIHLAGLQVPFCKADPSLGARVNVVGTVNVFEAAIACGCERVAYASSAAVYGPDEDGEPVDEGVAPAPTTHYGVYKQANEGTARIYWQDNEFSSAGLRPLTVYGVARDQGLTSDLTRAIKAAVVGREFTIRFGGATDALYAADCAAAFIACADRAPAGAHVFNLHGEVVEIARFVEQLDASLPDERRGRVDFDGPPLPIASSMNDRSIRAALGELPCTSLGDGIAATIERFEALGERGLLETKDLDA